MEDEAFIFEAFFDVWTKNSGVSPLLLGAEHRFVSCS